MKREYLAPLRKAYEAMRRAFATPPASGLSRWWVWPLLVAGFILFQQYAFHSNPKLLEGAPFIFGSTAIHDPELYDYGLYYWGLLPVYSTYVDRHSADRALYSKEAAERVLVERGDTLRMSSEALRVGERMIKVMKYPLALLRRSAFRLPHDVVLASVYTLGLLLLVFSLWRYGPFPLCIFLPVILSSSSFTAYDLYIREKTLTVPIIGAIYAMALLAPAIFDRSMAMRSMFTRLLALAAVFVFLLEIRATALPVLGAAALVLMTWSSCRMGRRLMLVGALVLSVLVLGKSFDVWWQGKYDEAVRVVQAISGKPHAGPIMTHHPIWHPIWCGLADFDTRYGYTWRDQQPYGYARRRLREQGAALEGTVDYTIQHPRYGAIIRGKILEDVREDPVWYLSIIKHRIRRILWENESPRLNLLVRELVLPVSPAPYVVVALLVVSVWATGYLRLLLLTLPTATVPLLVTTYGGQQHLSISHLALAAAGLTVACRILGRSAVHLASARRSGGA